MARNKRNDRQSIKRSDLEQLIRSRRASAASRAWEKAKLADRLFDNVTRGRKMLGNLKAKAIAELIGLWPEGVRLGLDSNYQTGLPSITFVKTGERLHLLWDQFLTLPTPQVRQNNTTNAARAVSIRFEEQAAVQGKRQNSLSNPRDSAVLQVPRNKCDFA
jgi:hypothetical protein